MVIVDLGPIVDCRGMTRFTSSLGNPSIAIHDASIRRSARRNRQSALPITPLFLSG
jgi:hypothetical protein